MTKINNSTVKPNANVFALALIDIEKLYKIYLVKTKSKKLEKANGIVIHNFNRGITNFVIDNTFHIFKEILGKVCRRFVETKLKHPKQPETFIL